MTKHNNTEAFFFLGIAVVSLFVVRPFIEPILWALLIASATWPAFIRARDKAPSAVRKFVPAIFTVSLSAVLFTPSIIGMDIIAEKAAKIIQWIISVPQQFGTAPPDWIVRIPHIGKAAIQHWDKIIHPDLAKTLSTLDTNNILAIGGGIAGFAASFLIFLLALFYIYSDGERLWESTAHAINRTFGTNVHRLFMLAATAISSNMRGGAILAVVEGIILFVVFALSGHDYPFLTGFACGALSPVPFAAPTLIAASASYMAFDGNIYGAIATGTFGGILILIVDPIIRARFGSEDTKLPFLAAIMGMFGGAGAFGLIGLFIGPAILSVGLAVWKAWTSREGEEHDPR